MLKFTVVAPDKRRVELECQPSVTFQEVKVLLEAQLAVPPDKQRLLCNGKERKNGAETLAVAGVKVGAKLMLMLAPGFSMPPAPGTAPAAAAEVPAVTGAVSEAAPVELGGELPVAAGAAVAERLGTVHVRQGRNRYHVRVPQGLAAATFGELADYMALHMLPPGSAAGELRFLCRGKTPERSEVLAGGDAVDLSIMLLFKEAFYLAAEGADWLRQYSIELEEAELKVEKIAKRVEANFADAETSLQLAEVGGLVEVLKQSCESVRVRETMLEDMARFRDRVLAVDARLEALRKGIRL